MGANPRLEGTWEPLFTLLRKLLNYLKHWPFNQEIMILLNFVLNVIPMVFMFFKNVNEGVKEISQDSKEVFV